MTSEHSGEEDRRSGVADALGGAAIYPARMAARAWRGRLETAAEEVLSAPETARIVDRALAGPLPEELVESLVRHRVLERLARELADAGELERLLDEALASRLTPELVDRLLASDEMRRALERVMSGPEVRRALRSQSAGLTEQVAAALRATATDLDRRAGRRLAGHAPFAGVASRGAALAADALLTAAICAAAGAAAGLVASLAGGVHPQWLAGTLLAAAGALVTGGYFTLFWSTVGQTPGMRLMHVRVRAGDADGRLGLGRAALRTVGLALAIVPFFLGFLPALFDTRRRALPDYLAGTVVVYDGEEERGWRMGLEPTTTGTTTRSSTN